MAVFDLFSKRQRIVRGEVPDVYVYDDLPNELRVQTVHILRDMLGTYEIDRVYGIVGQDQYQVYKSIASALAREYGKFHLVGSGPRDGDYASELFNFFLQTTEIEKALDVVELATRVGDSATRRYEYHRRPDFDTWVDGCIAELNSRFRERGIGYQYEGGRIVRLDSELLHSEAVRPALSLLAMEGFEGPQEEFLRAFEHYRHGRNAEALNDSLKAFESTMKAICDAKGWAYDKSATAKSLVDVCLRNGLVAEFWQSHLSGLRSTLEGSIATARNKLSGHGQGASRREVPDSIVAYVLHLTASTIVFLMRSSHP